mgnify:CR=1 FL=1
MKKRLLIATSPATEEQLRRLSRFAQVYELIKIPERDLDAVLPTMELMLLHSWPSIIMDDIDLYLGSRDKGSYTALLGQFLSFFDGVKKRKELNEIYKEMTDRFKDYVEDIEDTLKPEK